MSMNRGSSMQNGLTDTVTLTFDLLTPKAYHLEYIPRSSLYGIIRFFDLCCGQTGKQTKQANKQTVSSVLYIHADRHVGVGNE